MIKAHPPRQKRSSDPETRLFLKKLGESIRGRREVLKLTQPSVAKVVKADQSTISNAETGVNFLRLTALLGLTRILEMPLSELFKQAEKKMIEEGRLALLKEAEAASRMSLASKPGGDKAGFAKKLDETRKEPRSSVLPVKLAAPKKAPRKRGSQQK